MNIAINIPFEELLSVIKNLKPKEKQEIANLLIEETSVTEEEWKKAIQRKMDFEDGKIATENWQNLQNRLTN